jgi:hypothetical protein
MSSRKVQQNREMRTIKSDVFTPNTASLVIYGSCFQYRAMVSDSYPGACLISVKRVAHEQS